MTGTDKQISGNREDGGLRPYTVEQEMRFWLYLAQRRHPRERAVSVVLAGLGRHDDHVRGYQKLLHVVNVFLDGCCRIVEHEIEVGDVSQDDVDIADLGRKMLDV